jgi:hypothetical protein
MPDYPMLEFALTIGGWQIVDELYPDSGFEGGLAIPVGVDREILAEPYPLPLALADGSTRTARAWGGILDLEGHTFRVEVVALGSRYLLGREVLDQLEICFEFGRQVRLRFHD